MSIIFATTDFYFAAVLHSMLPLLPTLNLGGGGLPFLGVFGLRTLFSQTPVLKTPTKSKTKALQHESVFVCRCVSVRTYTHMHTHACSCLQRVCAAAGCNCIPNSKLRAARAYDVLWQRSERLKPSPEGFSGLESGALQSLIEIFLGEACEEGPIHNIEAKGTGQE